MIKTNGVDVSGGKSRAGRIENRDATTKGRYDDEITPSR